VLVADRLTWGDDHKTVVPRAKNHLAYQRIGAGDLLKAQAPALGQFAHMVSIAFRVVLSRVDESQPGVMLDGLADQPVGFLRSVLFGKAIVFVERGVGDLDPAFGEVIGARLGARLLFVRVAGAQGDGDAIVHPRDNQGAAVSAEAHDGHAAKAIAEDDFIVDPCTGVDGILECVFQVGGVDVEAEIEGLVRHIGGK
jgi:hypothetical protein